MTTGIDPFLVLKNAFASRQVMSFILTGAVIAFAYLALVHIQDSYEVTIMWNRISGQYWLEKEGGLHLTAPWVAAAKIDVRPQRVCISSSGRSFNKKLVRFNPDAYREFVAVEGTRYYWWANRISFNSGYDEEFRGMRDLLRGYAYSLKHYPFVIVETDASAPE